MKKILEMTSEMIIPGITFALIIAAITGGALLTKAGQRMDAEKEDFTNCIDTGEVDGICARNKPTITCTGRKNWKTGETISIDSTFKAKDAEGRQLTIKTQGITDETGNDAMDRYREASRTVSFSRRGVYTLRLSAMDSERKTAEASFSLAVDDR